MDNNMYELGYNYSKNSTVFKLWAPPVRTVKLLLYENYDDVRYRQFDMQKDVDGYFTVKINEDLDGVFYKYEIDNEYEIIDPYCKACSINSLKSCVVDFKSTDPQGFLNEKYDIKNKDEAIIYELSVKDFSSDSSSGVSNQNRGKFLGIIDENEISGINYLRELGITHVHLMPIFDFISVDERSSKFFDDDNYNWGYDPEIYNCIEGSYSIDPYNPKSRIFELKKMIQKLHENNIGVVMDVVFNHTFRSFDSPFNMIYPSYFYRFDNNGNFSNGSGVGNELKTENKMVGEFILESLLFYQREYHIDGFRFDLMALLDINTVNKIVNELRKKDKNVLIYGEPWMACSTVLDDKLITTFGRQKGFAFFNSYFRDAIKGSNDDDSCGFVQGNVDKNAIKTGLCGSICYDDDIKGFCKKSNETINYFNSHDNLILQDKISLTTDDIKSSTKLSFDLIMLSQGIPFFHCGNEFLRSKSMHRDSYNLDLSINAVNWKLKEENRDILDYVKSLIEFRKSHEEFHIADEFEIKNRIEFYDVDEKCICYSIKNKSGYLLIFINAGGEIKFNISDYFKSYNECIKIFDGGIIEEKQNNDIISIDKRQSRVYFIKTDI